MPPWPLPVLANVLTLSAGSVRILADKIYTKKWRQEETSDVVAQRVNARRYMYIWGNLSEQRLRSPEYTYASRTLPSRCLSFNDTPNLWILPAPASRSRSRGTCNKTRRTRVRHRGCTSARAFAGIVVRKRERQKEIERKKRKKWKKKRVWLLEVVLTWPQTVIVRKSILDVVVLYNDINCRVGDVCKLSCKLCIRTAIECNNSYRGRI